jgi:hypothetical protein
MPAKAKAYLAETLSALSELRQRLEEGESLVAKSRAALAESYIVLGLEKRRGVIEARPCPMCKTVTAIRCAMLFVCANCHLVFEDQ